VESRQSMVVGGAVVSVVTLAVASAVTISNVLALNDASGQALGQSAISLPAAIQRVAHATSHTDPVTVPAPAPATVVRSTHRTVVGSDAQASSTVETRTGAAAATGSATASGSTAANTTPGSTSGAAAESSAAAATAGAAAAQKDAVATARQALQREIARLTKPVEQAVHPHSDLISTSQISSSGTMQTPAIAAGDGSGSKESPSSAGSKKEQSPRSPDASD